VRVLHGSEAIGYTLQALVAVLSVALLLRAAARQPAAGPLVGAAVAASLLCTPYMFDYDLVCLLVPMAFLGAAALRTGWLPWEKSVLLGLFGLPLVARLVTTPHGIPLVPPLVFCLFLLCLRRAASREESVLF
jgi:hypothetical protein